MRKCKCEDEKLNLKLILDAAMECMRMSDGDSGDQSVGGG